MRLNTITSSIIHQLLNDETNIVYYPTLGIFDKILYLTNNNFFIFADGLKSCADNCRCLNSEFVDLYDYDICCANSIMSYRKQSSQISDRLNLNPIIFEHNLPDVELKKEDRFILNNDLIRIKKIFFDTTIMESWNFDNSVLCNYGIPTHKFFPVPDAQKTKDILISSGSVLGDQLKQHFEDKMKLKCDVVNNMAEVSIDNINKVFNAYEIFIDLNNRAIDCLCAASAGTYSISLSSLKNIDNVPNISQVNTIDDIVNIVPLVKNKNINIEEIHKYIDEHFNFNKFESIINSIFKNAKREAKIL
jgi:hypothetical protein